MSGGDNPIVPSSYSIVIALFLVVATSASMIGIGFEFTSDRYGTATATSSQPNIR